MGELYARIEQPNMPQSIHKQHPVPPSTQLGRIAALLLRIQLLAARGDHAAVWDVAEEAIRLANGRH
jgi:hypothetical protein